MTFKTLKHPFVYLSILFFLVYQIAEYGFSAQIPLLRSYLDDLLCMPVVLGLTTQIIQWIHPVRELYYLDKKAIMLVVAFYSILFEGLLPLVNSSIYTSDLIDVLFYGLGAFLFYLLISRKVQKEYRALLQEEEMTS